MEYEKYLVNGEMMYRQNCANCHGIKGEGLKSLYPPLANNKHLNDLENVVCVIKNGASGTIEVNGQTYDQAMPANLKIYDLDMAQLVTFLNKAFLEKEEIVKVDQVKIILENCESR
jgi:mono/diheme cytochrome c family protein